MPAKSYSWDEKNFSIFILGAGFSCAAGLPLASELWIEVMRRAALMTGRAQRFEEDLEEYISFRKDCDGITLSREEVHFEEFLGYLDLEFFLKLRGSDTWSDDGNETQVVVKTLIGQILTERTPAVCEMPSVYLRFAEKLRPGDYVLTFNYDVLLERALEAVDTPYRLFATRYKKIQPEVGSAIAESSRDEVAIIKLHGSVDWFDRRSFLKRKEWHRSQGASDPEDPVFNSSHDFHVVPLMDGPRFANDPLREVHRLLEIEDFYRDPPFFLATPSLIIPSTAKVLFAQQFGDFWYGLGQAGVLNFSMAIIGFSLAPPDVYTRQVIYGLVKNYQTQYWNEDISGKRKKPLAIVDFRVSAEEKQDFLERYAFVASDRAKFFFDGFNERVLTQI